MFQSIESIERVSGHLCRKFDMNPLWKKYEFGVKLRLAACLISNRPTASLLQELDAEALRDLRLFEILWSELRGRTHIDLESNDDSELLHEEGEGSQKKQQDVRTEELGGAAHPEPHRRWLRFVPETHHSSDNIEASVSQPLASHTVDIKTENEKESFEAFRNLILDMVRDCDVKSSDARCLLSSQRLVYQITGSDGAAHNSCGDWLKTFYDTEKASMSRYLKLLKYGSRKALLIRLVMYAVNAVAFSSIFNQHDPGASITTTTWIIAGVDFLAFLASADNCMNQVLPVRIGNDSEAQTAVDIVYPPSPALHLRYASAASSESKEVEDEVDDNFDSVQLYTDAATMSMLFTWSTWGILADIAGWPLLLAFIWALSSCRQ